MPSNPSLSSGKSPKGEAATPRTGDAFDPPEIDAESAAGAADIAAEAGIDLADASALDADNVTADEEHARVLQAPD